jgi:hypothetical protein
MYCCPYRFAVEQASVLPFRKSSSPAAIATVFVEPRCASLLETAKPRPFRYFLSPAISSVLSQYFAVGRLGLAVPLTSANVSPVWPAAGVGMALVLIWGIRVAPAVAVAAFLVNFFTPIPKLAALGIGPGNAGSAVASAYLLRHFLSWGSSAHAPSFSDSKILMLSHHDSASIVTASLNAGALGYVVKSDAAKDLMAGLLATSQAGSS